MTKRYGLLTDRPVGVRNSPWKPNTWPCSVGVGGIATPAMSGPLWTATATDAQAAGSSHHGSMMPGTGSGGPGTPRGRRARLPFAPFSVAPTRPPTWAIVPDRLSFATVTEVPATAPVTVTVDARRTGMGFAMAQ